LSMYFVQLRIAPQNPKTPWKLMSNARPVVAERRVVQRQQDRCFVGAT